MKKNTPKISILVPCYNVEKYLTQCLDSIVNQTLHDIEIICINDGSTDGTLNIIKQYAKQDSRIVIIDKENEGYGKSMNRGLDAATGEYIGIVESDDWVDNDMFENLVKIADEKNADIVKSNFYIYTTQNGESNVLCKFLNCCPMEQIFTPRLNQLIFFQPPAIWSAIYRRQFLADNKIKFLESPGASYQDIGFNFKALAYANRVWLTPRAWLHYRCDNANSSVKSTGKVFCVCDEYNEIERFLGNRMDGDMRKLLAELKVRTYFWNLDRLTGDAHKQFAERFASEFRQIVSNGYLTRRYIDGKSWYKLMTVLYPHNRFYRFMRVYARIMSAFIRRKVYGPQVVFYIFGVIPVYHTTNNK